MVHTQSTDPKLNVETNIFLTESVIKVCKTNYFGMCKINYFGTRFDNIANQMNATFQLHLDFFTAICNWLGGSFAFYRGNFKFQTII